MRGVAENVRYLLSLREMSEVIPMVAAFSLLLG